MATVGDRLISPEAGWKRYDETSSQLLFVGNWFKQSNSAFYNSTLTIVHGKGGDYCKFKFKGTKLRIIGQLNTDHTSDIIISVDGVNETFSEYGNLQNQVLVYEKTELPDAIHIVQITAPVTPSNRYTALDAVDIDDTGMLLHLDEVIDVRDLTVGKRIRAHYYAPVSGVVGTFSGLGAETSDFIPYASSATPNGDFYFIMVEDWNGEKRLIADRNIQHSISWDTLNSEGIASGSGIECLELSNSVYNSIIRLPTGGINSTDKDNEWDKYVVNSDLDRRIIPGDDNVWHWNIAGTVPKMRTITSTTYLSNSTYRVVRGENTGVEYYNSTSSSDAGGYNGFRPVLIIKLTISYDYNSLVSLINIKSDYKKLENGFYGYDKPSDLFILYRNDLTSTISVKPHGKMMGIVEVSPIYHLELESYIEVKTVSQLTSTISVKPHGKMMGIVEIMPPPRVTVELIAIEDAFVRSQVPRLNYGISQDMFFGYNSDLDEKYRSFVKFDLGLIPNGMKLTKAKLKLYFDRENQTQLQISIGEAGYKWSELGITWAGQPPVKNIINFVEVGQNKGYVEIDVFEVVNNWYKKASENNGFIIQSSEETVPIYYRFQTRESSFPPKLEVEFFDPVIKSYDLSKIPSTITIRQNEFNGLNSSLIIKDLWKNNNLIGNIHIYNFNYMLESSINVIRENMYSDVIVRRYEEDYFYSTLFVRVKRPNDIDSKLFVNQPYLNSEITIRLSKIFELNSSIIIRQSDHSEILSDVKQIRTTVPSDITVVYANMIDSNITVIRKKEGLLSSSIQVRQNDLNELLSNINVFQYNNLLSQIQIISGYLKSSITIPYNDKKDIFTNLTVRIIFANDLECMLVVGDTFSNEEYVFII